jgi:hypothetical protein
VKEADFIFFAIVSEESKRITVVGQMKIENCRRRLQRGFKKRIGKVLFRIIAVRWDWKQEKKTETTIATHSKREWILWGSKVGFWHGDYFQWVFNFHIFSFIPFSSTTYRYDWCMYITRRWWKCGSKKYVCVGANNEYVREWCLQYFLLKKLIRMENTLLLSLLSFVSLMKKDPAFY